MKSRTLRACAVAALMASTALVGCGSSDDETTTAAGSDGAAKNVRVGLLLAGETAYEAANVRGAKATAEKAGASVVEFSANFDPGQQLQQCMDVITAKKVDQLVIVPVDGSAILPCVAAAKDAGIGVFSIDTPIGPDYTSKEIQDPGVTGQVIQPITDDARAAVDMVLAACGDKDPCKVALGVGEPSFTYSASKLKYEKEFIAEHPNLEVVATIQTGLSQPDKAHSAAQDLLSKHKDLDVILTDDDIGLTGVERAIESAGRSGQIALIGDAASGTGVQAIKDGRWFGSVIYMPETTGAKVMEMAIAHGRGEELTDNNLTVLDLNPLKTLQLTKENVDEFSPEWDAGK